MIHSPSTSHLEDFAEYVSEFERVYIPFVVGASGLDEQRVRIYNYRVWEYCLTLYHADLKSTDVVLDVGGAASFFMVYASKYFGKGFIVDPGVFGEPHYREWLSMLVKFDEFKAGKVNMIRQSAASLPFPDGYFDKVFSFSALEHFEGDDDILACKEIHRVLKPDGIFTGTVDFNPFLEHPLPEHPLTRAYTYAALFDRLINPPKFKLCGEACYISDPYPETLRRIVTPLYFKLRKGER